ncbi:type II toxin-antitoxin system VapC family toxin [Pararhizobium sp.]|uniref:type II toxin-antitoxin system VapC family toxin n=1 Tax=Pararhizobium sp. TaxID=1977563 RepID=UPI002725068F|nr:type II toxin-antitoxin system VapC family toxin [Pararhizobium sp.]MDO9417534.1 type II toxin-antitoxin system VapC family toxin [Pararhizobium sp.]
MFVDASAIIAILTGEPDGEAFAKAIDASAHPVSSVLAVFEATVGLFRKKTMPMQEADAAVQAFIEAARITVLPIADTDRPAAFAAFERYGRHRHPDTDRNRALNLADCFHYATAKNNGVPILSKDIGFALTDVQVVSVGA